VSNIISEFVRIVRIVAIVTRYDKASILATKGDRVSDLIVVARAVRFIEVCTNGDTTFFVHQMLHYQLFSPLHITNYRVVDGDIIGRNNYQANASSSNKVRRVNINVSCELCRKGPANTSVHNRISDTLPLKILVLKSESRFESVSL